MVPRISRVRLPMRSLPMPGLTRLRCPTPTRTTSSNAMLQLLKPALVVWTGGSGDWNTAGNWSTGAVPGPTDDVMIGFGPSVTVTHSSGSHTVKSLTSDQVFVLTGGTLSVTNGLQVNNPFILSSGTLQNTTVAANSGFSLIASNAGGATLDGVTVNGVLDVGNSFNGGILTVTNGLVLNGTALVGNPANGWSGRMDFAGSQNLNGAGSVVFGNATSCNANLLRVANGGSTLTIGNGITVRGQNGIIGSGAATCWAGRPTWASSTRGPFPLTSAEDRLRSAASSSRITRL